MTSLLIHLLVLCLYGHHNIKLVTTSQPLWMTPKFPCDVTTNNGSKILFNCQGRHLRAVPDGITSNATDLNLSENFIKTISAKAFSQLLNLVWLNLSWINKKRESIIEKDTFKNLTKLHTLKLAGICLTRVPDFLPVSLENLDLHNNKIKYLDSSQFAGLTNLTNLELSRNCYTWNPCRETVRIMNNTFAGLTKLQDLDLEFNNLSQVPQELPQSLIFLNLGSNQIQHIHEEDFEKLHHLKYLGLQGNCPRCHNAPFPCVPCPNVSLVIDAHSFKDLAHLEQLNIGGNSLFHLNPTWFKNLKKLKKLLVAFNFLMKAFVSEATFLKYLPSLEVINLSFNYDLGVYNTTIKLSNDFSHLKSLRTLHMEGLVFQHLGQETLKPLYGLQNLTTLNLGTNFIIHSESTIFQKFHRLKTIYLAENRLYPTPGKTNLNQNDGSSQKTDFSISRMSKDQDFNYDITHILIKRECFNSGRVLILSENNVFFIPPTQFEGYGDIACLNLSGNGFSAAPNGTEFSLLPNLTYLDLSYNKIDLAYDNAFKELNKLQVLDLSHNAHYFEAFGITHNLNFLKNLPVLRVLNMSHNSISRLTTRQMESESLAELEFTFNFLGILWKERDGSYEKLFYHLTNLTNLDISHNSINKIPTSVFEYLPRNLIKLCISHNLLTDFSWKSLQNFHQLQILDLSYNSLAHVSPINSNITRSLTFLDLSHNRIFHLMPGFFTGPKSLKTLRLSYNELTTINQSTFLPGPENQLKTLFLQRNPFECTCDSLDFLIWISGNVVKIPMLTTAVQCDTPVNQKDKALIYFDVQECVNDSEAFLKYILTTSFIIVFMTVATASHLFYWDVSYMLHYVKAKLKGSRSLYSAHNIYDVFVTYDTKDPHVSEWVMKSLRVKLEDEGEKHLPLCLEERDWLLGVPLLDNLIHSIQYSRKTMFVLTNNYVKTGAFKLAMYLAHQRLLDENEDVIVLLMLEPVLQHSHFLRLRRRLCGKSVVEWPKTAAAEPWFWQNLRNVIKVDNKMMYNKAYSNYFSSK